MGESPPSLLSKWRRRRRRRRLQMAILPGALVAWALFIMMSSKTVHAGAIRQRHQDEDKRATNTREQQQPEFFRWVEEALNISTELVELKDFQYYDYIRAMKDRVDVFYDEEARYYDAFHQLDIMLEEGERDDNDDDVEDEDRFLSIFDYPTVSTRGLAAARDIEVGQIILQIPHNALWTVSNRIDDDAILSQVMGLDARLKHGWNSQVDEIPLLAVALLYHFQLFRHAEEEQEESPFWAYLQLLDETNVHDQIPHMWSAQKLRRSATVGVRREAKGIQKDVKELYQRILVPLTKEHPDIFGNHNVEDASDDDKIQKPYADEEWMFSLERFHWAFALVNSRHWHLPIPAADGTEEEDEAALLVDPNIQFDENGSPPASMPTEEWMDFQQQVEHKRDEESQKENNDLEEHSSLENNDWAVGNSFLAPVADMLNFGPPCTRGLYNTTTHTFDIVATCKIRKGQEITFWYADACQDVFMANYGFTLPTMVPTCEPFYYDTMTNSGFALQLERELLLTLDELDLMDMEMERLENTLEACNCDPPAALDYNKATTVAPASTATATASTPTETSAVEQNSNRMSKKGSSSSSGRSRRDARHAIRGASDKAPSVASSRKQSTTSSTSSSTTTNARGDSLSRSQKRKRRRATSAKEL
eukprot:scaffold2435_cov121-Cylindrotheca_fusiformis.AAC.2